MHTEARTVNHMCLMLHRLIMINGSPIGDGAELRHTQHGLPFKREARTRRTEDG